MSSLMLSAMPAQEVYTNPNGLFNFLGIKTYFCRKGRQLSQYSVSHAKHEDPSLDP